MKKMKAVGFYAPLPIESQDSLQDVTLPVPVVSGHDLLVQVAAVSVNPVDVGVRHAKRRPLSAPKIIGWDAYGTVTAVGDQTSLFKVGDKVYYAGSFKRPGSDSQYQLVDERIVGLAPKSIRPEEIAAMPLTALTAYEALFEQLQIPLTAPSQSHPSKTILIINGAGGVGSIATQLAKLAGLTVISTSSRPESIAWTKAHGADFVVNHRNDLVHEVHQLGLKYVDYILGLNDLDGHWNEMCDLIKPSGHIASITENHRPINLKKLTKKRGTFAWEWMYAKSYYGTDDLQSQHDILNQIAAWLDQGLISSTLTKALTPINAANLRLAHQLVESHHMIGKVVVRGWD